MYGFGAEPAVTVLVVVQLLSRLEKRNIDGASSQGLF